MFFSKEKIQVDKKATNRALEYLAKNKIPFSHKTHRKRILFITFMIRLIMLNISKSLNVFLCYLIIFHVSAFLLRNTHYPYENAF